MHLWGIPPGGDQGGVALLHQCKGHARSVEGIAVSPDHSKVGDWGRVGWQALSSWVSGSAKCQFSSTEMSLIWVTPCDPIKPTGFPQLHKTCNPVVIELAQQYAQRSVAIASPLLVLILNSTIF